MTPDERRAAAQQGFRKLYDLVDGLAPVSWDLGRRWLLQQAPKTWALVVASQESASRAAVAFIEEDTELRTGLFREALKSLFATWCALADILQDAVDAGVLDEETRIPDPAEVRQWQRMWEIPKLGDM